MAIGAYSAALLYVNLGISPFLGLFVGVAISLILAFIIGNAAFRLRGVFFSLLTISFVEIVRVVLLYWKSLTRGAEGVVITYREHSWASLTFRTNTNFYYIMLVILVISIFISWRVERSKMGYYLKAIRADQDAAESLGIEAYKIKLNALLISAVMTSVIGSFYAFFLAYIDPTTVSALAISTKIGSMAIVGGLGALFGPLIGAIVLVPLSELTNAWLGHTGSGCCFTD
ncbi:MAG: branched-chain amino acid ABC transporter permease [Tepidanaerobacteraceae bacterium]